MIPPNGVSAFEINGVLIATIPVSKASEVLLANSMEKAYKASEQLQTGVVAVNTPVVATAETPFGGIKQTGYGREGGSVGIKDYLNIKYTHLGLSG